MHIKNAGCQPAFFYLVFLACLANAFAFTSVHYFAAEITSSENSS
jgi:hypothetical protein